MQWPKLRVFQAAERTYTVFFENLSVFLLSAGGWMLMAFALRVGTAWLGGEFNGAESFGGRLADPRPLLAMDMFVSLISASAAAISWHRYILLNERAKGALAVDPKVFLKYLLRGILVFGSYIAAIIAVIALMPRLLGPSANFVLMNAANLAFAVAVIGAMLTIARVCLVFPAAAIEENRMTFTTAWRLTRGNSWRLFWGAAIVVVPVEAVSVFINLAFERIAPGASILKSVAIIGTDVLFLFVGVALAAGFASLAYRHFVEDRSRARSGGVGPTTLEPNS